MRVKVLALQATSVAVILALVELLSGYILNTRHAEYSKFPAFVSFAKLLKTKFLGGDISSPKIDLYNRLKGAGHRVHLAFPYDPQFSTPGEIPPLSNASDSKIILCDEGEGMIVFETDNNGFRKNQDETKAAVNYNTLFLGDSFTEGACVPSASTLPAQYQAISGRKTLNMEISGTGPIYQYVMLRSFLTTPHFHKKLGPNVDLIQVLFAGNDLINIREEKSSFLQQYLYQPTTHSEFTLSTTKDPHEKHSRETYFTRTHAYLTDSYLKRNQLPWGRPYGISFSDRHLTTELKFLDYTIAKTNALARQHNLNYHILLLHGHPGYSPVSQEKFKQSLSRLCKNLALSCMYVDLSKYGTDLWGKVGRYKAHLNSKGYEELAKSVTSTLSEINQLK